MKFRQHSQWVDADRCHFRERQELPDCRLLSFHIFYEVGPPTPAEIGRHNDLRTRLLPCDLVAKVE